MRNIFLALAVSITGNLGVVTSETGTTSAISATDPATGQALAVFCVTHAAPLGDALPIEGPGRLVYVPQPIPGLPAGVAISGPEPVAPALGVVPDVGEPVVFVAEGAEVPDSPELAEATGMQVQMVHRQDWRRPNGSLAGADTDACIAPGG